MQSVECSDPDTLHSPLSTLHSEATLHSALCDLHSDDAGPLVIAPAEAAPCLDVDLRALGVTQQRIVNAQRRADTIRNFDSLVASGLSPKEAGRVVKALPLKIWRWKRQLGQTGSLMPRTHLSGGKPEYMPTPEELALVKRVLAHLDHNRTGNGDITAYRLVACSHDPVVSEQFRRTILHRRNKTLPPSWRRLLDVPQAVVQTIRDKECLHIGHIHTPRNRTYVDANYVERPLRVGAIWESDDGTLNVPCVVPWPHGGDKCSEKFGVRAGRFQVLPIVDVDSIFCPAYHLVVRPKGSYRGEDVMALFGDTFSTIGRPEILRLERGSWESSIVRDALNMANVPVFNAWTSNSKATVEGFFNRLWTPLSNIPGHVGRDRARYAQVSELLLKCQEGRADPRDHFLSLSDLASRVSGAVNWANTELVKSRNWGQWIPQQRWEQQYPGTVAGRKMDPEMSAFFAREQRLWTVRKNLVGGVVAGPQIEYPVYFQTPELWEFEGCKIKAYFDPYDDPCLGTLVLQEEWRGFRLGHVIARDVPALDLPPQIVIAADGWAGEEKHQRSIEVRKQIAKLVRLEAWNYLGIKRSEIREGGLTLAGNQQDQSLLTSAATSAVARRMPALPPTTGAGRDRLARQAEHAARLQAMQTTE